MQDTGHPLGEPTASEPSERDPAPGRAEQQLMESTGQEVYERAVGEGWLDEADPDIARGTVRRAAVDLLVRLGLMQYDATARRFRPVDPTAVNDLLVVPMAQRGSELLARSAHWNEVLGKLGQLYRGSAVAQQRSLTEIEGLDAINRFIDSQMADARSELLFAQPYGRRRAPILAEAEPRDVAALKRGVSIRTIYQHSARQASATRDYVAEVTALGAQIRTSDEFFDRMLVFDGHTALIPATASHATAIAIHDKSVLAFLVGIFERVWERALPFTVEEKVAHAVAGEVRAMTMRLLVEGHSDAVSAKRLGVSARTYASYIAALKEEFGAQTRFQLGWAMHRSHGHEFLATTPAGPAPPPAGPRGPTTR